MKRKQVPKKIDAKIFKVTANQIHKKNLQAEFKKGGIRL